MKRKSLYIKILCAIFFVVVIIVVTTRISDKIYRESESHLMEMFDKECKIFEEYADRNKKLLTDWHNSIHNYIGEEKFELVEQYIGDAKGLWGFEQIYFVNYDGDYITTRNERGHLNLRANWPEVIRKGKSLVVETNVRDGNHIIFGIATSERNYNGFKFNAIMVSYDSKTVKELLKGSAYGEQSHTYIIDTDGQIVFDADLRLENHNISEYKDSKDELIGCKYDDVAETLESKGSGISRFYSEGEEYYMVYSYNELVDWMLLSIVPAEVIDKDTEPIVWALFAMVLCIGMVVIVYTLYINRMNLKRKDTELQYQRKLFDLLVSKTEHIFALVNPDDYGIEYISPNVERLLGIPSKDIEKGLKMFGPATENTVIKVPQGIKDASVSKFVEEECTYTHLKTREQKVYQEIWYRSEMNDEERYLLILFDRTSEVHNRKKLWEALEIARKASDAKTTFLSNMSHDIRTPMNAVVGFCTLIEKDASDEDKVKQLAKRIKVSSKHLLSLINNILDMSKIESGKATVTQEEFRLSELIRAVETVIVSQAEEKKQEYSGKCINLVNDCFVGDALRIRQILLNLLSNAVKYTQEFGKITMSITQKTSKIPNYARICFKISDNGMGMAKDYIKDIFEPFSRETQSTVNKIQGTGLGLAITKKLVDLMGGTIVVDSKKDCGTVFAVELDLLIVDNVNVVEDSAEVSLAGVRILAAEDNEVNIDILQEIFTMLGATIVVARDGKEVVEMFETSAPGSYDVILMDVQMPFMNGYEATRAIRSSEHPDGKDIKIIAMTADAFADDVKAALDSGMNAHVAKPMDIDLLTHTILSIISK